MNKSNIIEVKEKIKQSILYKQIKQRSKIIAGIVAPPILWVVMFFIYQLYGLLFGSEIGWYLGLLTYWIVCGLLLSLWLIGFKMIKELSTPRKLRPKLIPLITIPIVLSLIFRFISGTEYNNANLLRIILLIITAFGNGIFEEILWRGVYMALYPDNYFLRFGYSTFWYAIFHFASGSLSSNASIFGLVIGSTFFGIYLALLAKYTGNIWWGILCHVLGGLVIVL
jgi:membrane protease YdiL (CAAX protease family)